MAVEAQGLTRSRDVWWELPAVSPHKAPVGQDEVRARRLVVLRCRGVIAR
jgi:hypothetical protein